MKTVIQVVLKILSFSGKSPKNNLKKLKKKTNKKKTKKNRLMASKLYGVNATIIIFVFVLYYKCVILIVEIAYNE